MGAPRLLKVAAAEKVDRVWMYEQYAPPKSGQNEAETRERKNLKVQQHW